MKTVTVLRTNQSASCALLRLMGKEIDHHGKQKLERQRSTDRCREHKVNLTNEINDGEHEELIKGLLDKIIGKNYATHASNKKT